MLVAWSNLLAYGIAAAIIVAIPGPSVLFAIGRALTLGRASAWVSVVGNSLGVFLQVIVVTLGLGAVITTSPAAFTVVKIVGAGYLIYLGVQSVRHRGAGLGDDATPARSAGHAFRDGVTVGATNPKSLVFLGALLPQFVSSGGWPQPVQLLVLGVIFCVIAVLFDSVWVFGAAAARRWFGSSPGRLSGLRGGGGVLMILLGLITLTVQHS